MSKDHITNLLCQQRTYFATGATLDIRNRAAALKRLRAALKKQEAKIANAVLMDLGKSPEESFMCEIGMVRSEISHMLRHLRRYAREKRVPTPLAQFHSRSYQKPSPYGTVLIMSPWNYPVLLTLGPLVDALAAGNTVILKPSAYAAATSQVLQELISSIYPPEYVAVVTGGREENTLLLEQKFDYILFTGSKTVGKSVLEKAARHLTPVTLELGGKSPCIVDKTANIKLAARRIVFGKFLNCGQTCVAPDYILCHSSVKKELLIHICNEIRRQYGDETAWGKIISPKHFQRICNLIDQSKVHYGGRSYPDIQKIEPTVLDNVTWSDAVMGEEIFGPVLPILTFDTLEEVISSVNSHDKPLALYLFTEDRDAVRQITSRCSYGGGCINDCIIHLATANMGFGGVGESGMGAYHGKTGFDTFSHYKSIVNKKTWLDLPMRYRPYKPLYQRLIRFFLK